MPAPTNLMAFDRAALEDFFSGIGERPFRARQVLQWIYRRQTPEFARMTDLSESLRRQLGEIAEVMPPRIAHATESSDGTCKWLMQLADGNCIESVFIPEAARGTLCVSSQVGCALNCSFCATARQGYNRNLSVDEIIGQVWLAARELAREEDAEARVTNVVLMGMGEPMLNLDNVIPAMALMLDDLAFGLSRRRVTLSTAGVVPGFARVAAECPVSLAVSLHAPNDALRDQLVPLNKKYPLAELLEACRGYAADTGRGITLEYVMLKDINDQPHQAEQLAQRIADLPAKVNLIPFNRVRGIACEASTPAAIDAFRDVLLARDIFCVTRKTRGDDIDAACGQLSGDFTDRTRRSVKAPVNQPPAFVA